MKPSFPPWLANWLVFLLGAYSSARAGLHPSTMTPANLPWPGGVVPYVFDASLSAAQKETYLDGLREWELAANVHFKPRESEIDYILFKYSPGGPNLVSGTQPQTVEINLLTRGQICHEMGHSLGLEHEHQRPDRDGFITVLYPNITSGNSGAFDILSGSISFGAYDFESVMHYGRDVYTTTPGLDTIQPLPAHAKYQRRLSNATLSPTDRAHLASLYGPPATPLTSVVTTTADGGPGSLRAAIYFTQDHPGSVVTFNIPTSDPGHVAGVFTIHLTGVLPTLATDGLVIDATTQPGYAGKPVVCVDGSGLLPELGFVPAFLFYESNCTVKGLAVQNFPWSGMVMLYGDAAGNRILGCHIGADAGGNNAAPNLYQGVQISDGAHDNFVGGSGSGEGNVISGNTQYGVHLSGSDTHGNRVSGNRIGTNADGGLALPNQASGIIITNGAHDNVVSANVLSGNTEYGTWISGTGTSGNSLEGNLIGTNKDGNAAIPNWIGGAILTDHATLNVIGGTSVSSRNIISGNVNAGVFITGTGTTDNLVEGNYLGTSSDGLGAVPNSFAGIYLIGGCSGNHVGAGPGTGNLISGNNGVGILVADPGTSGNFIRNNRIGPDSSGANVFSNQYEGIRFSNVSTLNQVGGSSPGAANIICGNSSLGIVLYDAMTSGQSFLRNSIHGNGWKGIGLSIDTNHNQLPPVLSSASLTTGTTISGTFSGSPDTSFTIEFFASPDARDFIGETTATTNGSGNGSFSATLPAIVEAGRSITATATSLTTGDTSEFSNEVTVSSLDTDNDGMPDAYEQVTPGLSSSNSADASIDKDGDGFTNLQEFIAGTDPNDSNSRLVSTGQMVGENFVITFPGKAGIFYQLQRADSPGGPWKTIAVHIAGNGSVMEVSVPLDPSALRAFFKVGVAN